MNNREKEIKKRYQSMNIDEQALKDANGIDILIGDEVYWNDPAIHDLETDEERKDAWLTIWKVDSIDEENEMVCISTEYSEAEVYPRELEVAIYIRNPDEYETI